MGSYIPATETEQAEMLASIGCSSFDSLFQQIPKEIQNKADSANLPDGISELEVKRMFDTIASQNTVYQTVFRGAGAYRHYIPSIVKAVTSKEEFISAYTPYQAEISQGILQSIFEFQTMLCMLTGMDVANASVYDGATAAAEAVAMCTDKKRRQVIVSSSTNPSVIETIQTYCFGSGTEVIIAPSKNGLTDIIVLESLLNQNTACLYIQQPNFYGLIEDAHKMGELIHNVGAHYIMGCNPISLAILKTPKECGADIAVGEGQPLGLSLNFGGPYLGFMACTNKMLRRLPGRLVGQTVDMDGKRSFVLTLQAREQHIKREKASSNICSNQAYCALTASVYLGAMGKEGLREVAIQCMSKAKYLSDKLSEIGFTLKYTGQFFHEFVTVCSTNCNKLMLALAHKGILGGYPIHEGKEILWCVTELNTKEEMDTLVSILQKEVQ